MDFLKFAINRPVTIAVFVILIVLFGLIGLTKLPVQLVPDTELPKIEVNTQWSGATPAEMESEIVEKQEEKLKSLLNLLKMESSCYNGYAKVTLTFDLATDLNTALLRVSNKLNQVEDYPENVRKPVLSTTGASDRPIIFFDLKMKSGDPSRVAKYQTFFENEVKQYIERVPGVASLWVFGGTREQLEIVLDPVKMARYRITIEEVIQRIIAANRDTSAGTLHIDRKSYRIRTATKFQNPLDPMEVVIFDDGVKRVLLRDIATSRIGYETQHMSVLESGSDSFVIGVKKQRGANVLDVVKQVREVVDWLNNNLLAEKNMYLKWTVDPSRYILSSIRIMKNNVLIGGLLAVCGLMLFLRSVRTTLTAALAIPVSAIGTFIFLWLFHRNLNVVSLAGISFAIGMLVDNSIVVLENIDRHRGMGKKISDAVYDGAKEVYGAILASTLTTVAVFLPVIFMQQETGQLFRDIAIAITFAILISLFVSVTAIPTAMNLLFRKAQGTKVKKESLISRFGLLIVRVIMAVSGFFQRNLWTRLTCIVLFTALALICSWILMPKAEYLPQGNRNILFNILVPPPGYSAEKRREVGDHIYRQIKPYMKEQSKDGMPRISNLFYVSADEFSLFGIKCVDEDETRTSELIPVMIRLIHSLPGMFGVSIQPGIFEAEFGKSRNIEVNISGEKLPEMVKIAGMLFGAIGQAIPNSQIRPVPSLEISYPECNIVPDRGRLAANGLSEADLGTYVDVLMDGRKIDEFRPEGTDQIDLVIRGEEKDFQSPEDILNCSIVNRHGDLIRLGDVAHIAYTRGMTQIARLEKKRNIRLEVTPPGNIPLQSAMEAIQQAVDGMARKGMLKHVEISMGGHADKLVEARQSLQWSLLLALVITYLLMSALFENFLYPLIIMFSIPLAAVGGFIGLRLANILVAPQPLDVLTMLGFVILVGTVVNNAILIVHQALNNIRFGAMDGREAIRESVRTRIRPIFMSTSTTIFAMLPLVISKGWGSELYRGIGSVLLGGLAVSTIFTLFVIPALLAFFIGFEKKRQGMAGDSQG
ncbi:MAG: efflux RND transporter permease subunit [Deltaproteobacteria bacterium]|nr:efflux RND transporter permease subunit [Deltaproteobacteria bacterium]